MDELEEKIKALEALVDEWEARAYQAEDLAKRLANSLREVKTRTEAIVGEGPARFSGVWRIATKALENGDE